MFFGRNIVVDVTHNQQSALDEILHLHWILGTYKSILFLIFNPSSKFFFHLVNDTNIDLISEEHFFRSIYNFRMCHFYLKFRKPKTDKIWSFLTFTIIMADGTWSLGADSLTNLLKFFFLVYSHVERQISVPMNNSIQWKAKINHILFSIVLS